MNKDETLALYAQGKDAWNKWATDLLAEKKRLEENGEWEAKRENWEERAEVDFSGFAFPELSLEESAEYIDYAIKYQAYFKGFKFPCYSSFQEAVFEEGGIDFSHTVFYGDANFENAKFSGDIYFCNAKFKSGVSFKRAKFRGRTSFYPEVKFEGEACFQKASFIEVVFSETTFSDNAHFHHVVLEENAYFDKTTFKEEANFKAINSKAGFEMGGAKFATVPNFIQAHFLEAPRLDNVSIPEDAPHSRHPREGGGLYSPAVVMDSRLRGNDGEGGKCGEQTDGTQNNNITARYRALKRMAIQAHDHRKEQDFFAGELKSMRGHTPKDSWYWMGLFYETLSDFGRSMLRPMAWLGLLTLYFSLYYFFLQEKMAFYCAAGKATTYGTALMLSVKHAVFPFGKLLDNSERLYKCLYGDFVPYVVTSLELLQSLFSLILIFLLLLAIRAHFRVK